jgi:hypothetical protein
VNLIWIAFMLSDYTTVWVAPEANTWRGYLSADRPAAERYRQAFDWHVFEVLPRLTRPLSSLMETLDNSIRKRLWQSYTPHPTLSLTWLFTLALSPILFYGVLRALGVRDFFAWCGVALYLCNSGVLSLLAIGFRPGKAMACAATVIVLWWASRLRRATLLSVIPLYLFLFLSLFWDEIALIAFPAVLLLFPSVVFSSWATGTTFFLIPVGYAMSVKWVLPAVHAAAGFPVPAAESFWPLDRATSWLSLSSSSGSAAEFRRYFRRNARIALMDSLGLINPTLTHSVLYYAIFAIIAGCLILFAFLIGRRIVRLRTEFFKKVRGASVPLRAAAFLVVCLVFHELLLCLVEQKTWGLYWYGAFIVIGVVVTITTLLEHLNIQNWVAALFVLFVSLGSFYVFPATNRAYKGFHYYPYRAIMLRSVFENKLNRFEIAGPSASSSDMRRYTRQIARRTPEASFIEAPAELLYVVYELGLDTGGEGCRIYTPTFSYVTSPDGSRLDCREPAVNNEEVDKFLGVWLTPDPVTIKANDMFVVLEDGVPRVAQVERTQIDIIEKKINGRLSADGSALMWSNGAMWQRRSGSPSSVEGRWWSDTGSHVIRKATNRDVLIISDTYSGLIQPDGVIVAPERGSAGQLSSDGKRLIWTEGGTWTRP